MRKCYQVAVLAGLFSTLLACSVERTPSGPSALTPIGALIGSGSGDRHETSWACATRTAAAEPSVTTGEWTIQPENCSIGTPSILSQSASVAASEPIFAPGPTNFRSTVNGSVVLLQWDQAAGASGWQIEAGSSAGSANLAVLRLGPVANFPGGTMSYTVTGVPNGVYFVRVRSTRVDFSDVSVPSNEIIVAVGTGCTSAPNAPAAFSSSVIGNTVNLQWAPPTSGPPPTSYLLEVGSAAGLSDILVFDTGNAGTSLQAFAPSRTYFVRLRSRNACGTSANAFAIVVVVGGTTSVLSTSTIPVGSSSTTTTPSTTTILPTTTTPSTTTIPPTTTTPSTTTIPPTTTIPATPTASFSFSPGPCLITTSAGGSTTENCTFNAAGSNAGSGTITAYIWNYLGNSVQTAGPTLVPTFGGCGLSGGQQVSVPVTLQVRNSFNLTSAPFNLNVTVRKVNACGFGN